MITLQRASRWYGQVIGINDVSCQIGKGITALLGPNGAGKSTMMKLVTGQLRPTTGEVTVLEQKPFANPRVFRRLGYCPEIESCYDEMTGIEFVTMLGAMGGIAAAELKKRVAEVIERVGMTPNAERKIGGYSKGMRQRIKMAQAIIHDPDVLILDEPLNGLDPIGRREMSAILLELGTAGKCIVISSHILYEVEQMTQNILLMNHGRLLAQGDVHQIRSLIDAHPHRITITSTEARRLGKRLLDLPYVLSVRFNENLSLWLEIETRSPERFYTEFPEIVLEGGFVVPSFESPDNNLESVFKYLVGS
ncbi:MAG: ABC transporter ATP-binding protein [Chloroflexi bacterium]|nr:ABC transporter ATP-binding protein [Chloroflexota bacterium]